MQRRRWLRGVVERPGSPEQLRRVQVRGQRPGQGVWLWPARSGRTRVSGDRWSARLFVRGGRCNGCGCGPAAVGRGRRRVQRRPCQLRVVPGGDWTQPEVHHHRATQQERIRVAQECTKAQGCEEQKPSQVRVF